MAQPPVMRTAAGLYVPSRPRLVSVQRVRVWPGIDPRWRFAPAYVSSSGRASPDNSAPFTTQALNISAGNHICVFVGWEDGGSLSSASDTAGNTLTVRNEINTVGAGPKCGWVYGNATSGNASDVITIVFTGSPAFIDPVVFQASGIDTSSAGFDQANHNSGTGTTPTTGSITTTVADEIIYAGVKGYATVNFSAWLSSFTEVQDVDTVGGAYRVVNATGTYSSGATMGSADWAASIISFKGASATFAGDEDIKRQWQPKPRVEVISRWN